MNGARSARGDSEATTLNGDLWREGQRATAHGEADVAAGRGARGKQVGAHPDAAAREGIPALANEAEDFMRVEYVGKMDATFAQVKKKCRLRIAVEVHRNEAHNTEEVEPERAAVGRL